jgi:hypothetical protein
MYRFDKFSGEEGSFQKASFFERCAFKELMKIINLNSYEVKLTPINMKTPYDVLLIKYDYGSVIERIVIEIKIRSFIGESYWLEGYKYKNIKNLFEKELYYKPEDYKRVFLNFTPVGTFFWNMDLIKDKQIGTNKINKTTANIGVNGYKAEKVNKHTYDMLVTEAFRKVDFIWKEEYAIPYYEKEFGLNKPIEEKKKGGLESLFKI